MRAKVRVTACFKYLLSSNIHLYSVLWAIDELISEFAKQIYGHIQKTLNLVKEHHWRTNPAVLNGTNVAIIDKHYKSFPKVLTGYVREGFVAHSNVGLKLQVDPDVSQVLFPSPRRRHSQSIANERRMSYPFSPTRPDMSSDLSLKSPTLRPQSATSTTTTSTLSYAQISLITGDLASSQVGNDSKQKASIVIEVVGDFQALWVQSSGDSGDGFTDADSYSFEKLSNILDSAAIQMFWEMLRSIIELPALTDYFPASINYYDIIRLLKQVEYKVLWITECVQHLPADVAVDLIMAAYVTKAE